MTDHTGDEMSRRRSTVSECFERLDLNAAAAAAERVIGMEELESLRPPPAVRPELLNDILVALLAADDPADPTQKKLLNAAAVVEFAERVGRVVGIPPIEGLRGRAEAHTLYGTALQRMGLDITRAGEPPTDNSCDRARRVAAYVGWVRTAPRAVAEPLLGNDLDNYLFHGSSSEHRRLELAHHRLKRLQGRPASELLPSRLDVDLLERIQQTSYVGIYWLAESLVGFAAGHLSVDQMVSNLYARALDGLESGRSDGSKFLMRELSVRLAMATIISEHDGPEPILIDQLRRSMQIIQRVRTLRRVTVRSHGPLAQTLRRNMADIGIMVAANGSEECARIGLEISLALKQMSIARLVRDKSVQLPKRIRITLEQLAGIDRQLAVEDSVQAREELTSGRSRTRGMARLMQNLDADILDLADPQQTDPDAVIDRLGGRFGVDYVSSPTTFGRGRKLFRLEIHPDRTCRFAVMAQADKDHIDRLLPVDLVKAIEKTVGVADVIISPDDNLIGAVRWPSRWLESSEAPIITKARIMVTPSLATLAERHVPWHPRTSYVRLVTETRQRINIDLERRAWGLDARNGDGLYSYLLDHGDSVPRMYEVAGGFGSIMKGLATKGVDFIHIAGHGGGAGLDHQIRVPEAVTAAEAFLMRWPDKVLLASCHLGEFGGVDNIAEPLAFSLAALVGGASEVVAGVGAIDDESTARMAADIVRQVLEGDEISVSLAEMLRRAQVRLFEEGVNDRQWSCLVSYID